MAAPIIQAAGIPMVSAYAVHPDVVNAGDYIFSQSFPARFRARQELFWLSISWEQNAFPSLPLIWITVQSLREPLREYAKAHGAEIVSYDKVAMSDNEFTSIITKLNRTLNRI